VMTCASLLPLLFSGTRKVHSWVNSSWNRTQIALTHAFSVTTNDAIRKSDQDLSRVNIRLKRSDYSFDICVTSADAIGANLYREFVPHAEMP